MTPLLVVGAHLDDAVLSCGRLLAATPGAVVCTVFAGRPDVARGHTQPGTTEWDSRCGFRPGDDVVGVRHAEDDDALAVLGARPVRLPFVDAQYAPAPALPDVAQALAAVVRDAGAERVVVPLGLLHRDHRTVAAAWVRLVTGGVRPGRWDVVEDQPYRRFVPVRHRLAALRRLGVRLGRPQAVTDADLGPAARLPADAVRAYTSQHRGLHDLQARGTTGGSPAGSRPATHDPDGCDVVRPLLDG